MSQHDPCRVGAPHNGGSTFLVLPREVQRKRKAVQARRIRIACQPIKPGEGPEAQILNGAKAFDITYDEGWRAWHRRASMELCDVMDERWPAVEAHLREIKARALADFILDMQDALDGTRPPPLRGERLFDLAGLSGFSVLDEA